MPLSDHKRFLVLASRNRGRGSSGTHAFGCTHVIAAKVRGGEQYMQYRKGDRHLPDDFPLHVRWEEAWMKSTMENEGRDLPPMPIIQIILAGPCSHLQVLNQKPLFMSKFLQQMPAISPLSWTAHSGRNLGLNKLPSSKSRLRLLPVHRVRWFRHHWPSVWWRRWSPRDNKPQVEHWGHGGGRRCLRPRWWPWDRWVVD